MTAQAALTPLPLSVTRGDGRIDLGPRGAVTVAVDADLLDTLNEMAARTRGIRFVPMDAGSATVEFALGRWDDISALPLPQGVSATGGPVDERYVLTAEAGRVTVRAHDRAGLIRGATTLLQLVEATDRVGLDEVTVADAPRYAWRGLSLDVARRFFPVDEIERVIDLLAWHRMNVLHLHLSDTQAWRLEVAGYPALTAESPSYSAAQLHALDAYATRRGITLIGELDMPGHTRAALDAYPALIGAEPPHPAIASLDPGHPPAVAFARAALTELAGCTSGPFLHIGGDEAFGMPDDAYARFVRIVVDHVYDLGRRVVGWQETTRAGALDAGDVAQLWVSDRDAFDADAMRAKTDPAHHALIDLAAATFAQAPRDIGRAVEAGVPGLVSSSFPPYLDRPYAETAAAGETADRAARVGFTDYPPEPMTTLARWDPAAHVAEVLGGVRVAGVEAALWCETVTSFDDAAFLLLPRLALVAERAWNPGADTARASGPLHAHAPVWDALGFGAHFRPAAGAGLVSEASPGER